jgi:hypothetical protein
VSVGIIGFVCYSGVNANYIFSYPVDLARIACKWSLVNGLIGAEIGYS